MLGLLLLSGLLRFTQAKVSCLGEDASAVDWFAVLSSGTGSAEYWYIDSSELSDDSFAKSKFTLDQSSTGALMQSVSQIYNDDSNKDLTNDSTSIAYAMYNDEPPPSSTESSTYAHAKGILMADTDSAAWIVHSKPHWPDADSPAPLPDFQYAQSFMCITLTLSEFESISALLQTSYPYFYASNLPDSLNLPNFSALISKTKVDATSDSYSFGDFAAFAKSRTWGKDLWEDLVAPSMGGGMYVETWRDGSGGRMPSFCADSPDPNSGYTVSYDVLFVNQVNMTDDASWSGTKDHSKWGVGITEKFACVGDINRICSQESRGGGALCLRNDNLWAAFSKVRREARSEDIQGLLCYRF